MKKSWKYRMKKVINVQHYLNSLRCLRADGPWKAFPLERLSETKSYYVTLLASDLLEVVKIKIVDPSMRPDSNKAIQCIDLVRVTPENDIEFIRVVGRMEYCSMEKTLTASYAVQYSSYLEATKERIVIPVMKELGRQLKNGFREISII